VRTCVVLFTRDLRVHDQPALAAAVREHELVVPLFVLDPALERGAHRSPRRRAFLLGALAGLDEALRERGGRLVLRRGDTVAETTRVARETGADSVYVSADASAFAQRRERELRVRSFAGTTVVPLDELRTGSGGHYRVFSPYWRRWSRLPWRELADGPEQVRVPALESAPLETDVRDGEGLARTAMRRWLRDGIAGYGERQRLDLDATSRLSPYLHLGCLSPLELAVHAREYGADEFVRQLCWRDFYAQLLFHRPGLEHEELVPARDEPRDDEEALAAWREGRTGIPVVDAGMRQLAQEGWMHNRARLLTASFLVRRLGLDWRAGAAHFFEQLLDGDVASNVGNWQWVAGTGVDPRPYMRTYNPVLQARRHDPEGRYVRRWVPELAPLGAEVHEPWTLGPGALRELGYPEPLVVPGSSRQLKIPS
jgi:deoxyribodipyrimidine photo-lyase